MNFEDYVPAAIIAVAILGTWIDVRREVSGLRGDLFTLNGRVSNIEGLLTPKPVEPTPPAATESNQQAGH